MKTKCSKKDQSDRLNPNKQGYPNVLSIHPSSTSKIGWLIDDNLLEFLHNLLLCYGLIECDKDSFKTHFKDIAPKTISYVKWLGNVSQLIYLFDKLLSDRYIPDHHNRRHIILKEHFCNRYEDLLDNKIMRSIWTQLTNNTDGTKMIDEIYEEFQNSITKLPNN